ncbi:hypothetical protein SSP35_40_00200 [Streptomyces sp. NBRC 110611]|nr:hypothetical protein [Streptomyces sp. NBRC 110611]GAU71454.1 hypothetical protein SSP35_40_00200 [Streptomyces sp. NBRC 110611]
MRQERRATTLLDRLAQVLPEVKAICDLDRVRHGRADRLRVRARAVTAHDLGAGMFFEPGGEGLGGAVGQDVDDAAGLDVDEDGAVDVTALECEVVDAQYPRAPLRRLGRQPPHTAEQGVRADRAVQQGGEPGTGPTG